MSSSSTSSSDAPPRALTALAVVLIAVLTVLGVEGVLRATWTPPGELHPKIAATLASLDADVPDVLVFGTCLGDQALDGGILDGALHGQGRAHSLSAPGAYPMDWYLTLRRVLDPRLVDAVVVVHTPLDLQQGRFEWQSETLDLLDNRSMRELAWWACTEPACVADLYGRRFSLLYRNRAYLANRAWLALGARDPRTPPARAAAWRARPSAASEAPFYFTRRFVQVARERGTPVLFLELPANPMHGAPKDAELRTAARAMLAAEGATTVRPEVPASAFADDVHFTDPGRAALTRALADALVPLLKPTEVPR